MVTNCADFKKADVVINIIYLFQSKGNIFFKNDENSMQDLCSNPEVSVQCELTCGVCICEFLFVVLLLADSQ